MRDRIIDTDTLLDEVPAGPRNKIIGRLTKESFIFATCMGSQFAVNASPILPKARLDETSRPSTEFTVEFHPRCEFEIPGIHTLPKYNALVRLETISQLQANWDEYDAPAVNKDAVKHCRRALDVIDEKVFGNLQIQPNEYGGVLLRCRIENVTVFCCDFGDDTMSYYTQLPDREPRDFAFISYSQESLRDMAAEINNIFAD